MKKWKEKRMNEESKENKKSHVACISDRLISEIIIRMEKTSASCSVITILIWERQKEERCEGWAKRALVITLVYARTCVIYQEITCTNSLNFHQMRSKKKKKSLIVSLHPKQKEVFNTYMYTLSKSIPYHYNEIKNSTGICSFLKHIKTLPTD